MHLSKKASVQEITKVCLVMFPTGKLQLRSHGARRGFLSSSAECTENM